MNNSLYVSLAGGPKANRKEQNNEGRTILRREQEIERIRGR